MQLRRSANRAIALTRLLRGRTYRTVFLSVKTNRYMLDKFYVVSLSAQTAYKKLTSLY